MDSKNKSPLWKRLLVITILMLLYTALFPRIMGKDLLLSPLTASTWSEKPLTPLPSGGFYLTMGDKLGAADPKGELVFGQKAPERLSVSSSHFSWYEPGAGIYARDRAKAWTPIPQGRYSFWIKERLYLVDENRMALSEADSTGRILWSKEFTSLITAVDAGLNSTAVGTSDGTVWIYNKNGEEKLNYSPGGSRQPIIFNLSFGPQENSLAIVAGLSPKRFVLLAKTRDEYRPVFHKAMEDEQPEATAVGYLGEWNQAYYADKENLHLIALNSYNEQIVPIHGTLKDLTYDSQEKILNLLTLKDNVSWLELMSEDGAVVSSVRLPAQENFYRNDQGRFYLGFGERLITLERNVE